MHLRRVCQSTYHIHIEKANDAHEQAVRKGQPVPEQQQAAFGRIQNKKLDADGDAAAGYEKLPVLAQPVDEQATAMLGSLQWSQANGDDHIRVALLQALEPIVQQFGQLALEWEQHGAHEEGPQQRTHKGAQDEADGHKSGHARCN